MSRATDGWTFVSDVTDHVPALWGDGGEVIWADGEPLMLVGPDGVGKTALGQQLALARVGLASELLRYAVAPAHGRVLYIAADRPAQAARSMRRMVQANDAALLRERLVVHRGPLEFDLARDRHGLVQLAEKHGATDVFIDSLKDVQPDLVKDEVGSRVSIAFQELIASGRQLVVNHHQRKESNNGSKPKRLADVYGSRWLTASMGSVLLLWGEPGDLVVEARHLKQPAEEVGPLSLLHDHAHGRTTIHEGADLKAMLDDAAHGVTVSDAAQRMFTTSKPTRNEIEKARRRLDGHVRQGTATRHDDPDGLARYFHPEKAP